MTLRRQTLPQRRGVAMWVLGAGVPSSGRSTGPHRSGAHCSSAVFAYNANLMWGFFNYWELRGRPQALLAFAAWIATEKRAGLARSIGFALAATLLYFCHVVRRGDYCWP